MKTTLKKISATVCIAIGVPSVWCTLFSQSVELNSHMTQIIQNKNEHFRRDTSAAITLFTATLVERTVYLHWNTAKQKSNGLYVIYRSHDGGNYEVIGYKKGVGVPIQSDIAYYFADESPCPGTNYYGIVHIGCNQTFLASKIIGIENADLLVGYKINSVLFNHNVTLDR